MPIPAQKGVVIDQLRIVWQGVLPLYPAHLEPLQHMLVVVLQVIQASGPRDRSDQGLVDSLLVLVLSDLIHLDLFLPSMPSLSVQHSTLHI